MAAMIEIGLPWRMGTVSSCEACKRSSITPPDVTGEGIKIYMEVYV
jgi:hypothetical protein